ncbi:hypothetical protein NL676_033047 [Syzygium grande]|nr:hypothetical protein NL676_033047 [Syzygium grande]
MYRFKVESEGEYTKTWHRYWFVPQARQALLPVQGLRLRHPRLPSEGIILVASCLTVNRTEDILNKQYTFELSCFSQMLVPGNCYFYRLIVRSIVTTTGSELCASEINFGILALIWCLYIGNGCFSDL